MVIIQFWCHLKNLNCIPIFVFDLLYWVHVVSLFMCIKSFNAVEHTCPFKNPNISISLSRSLHYCISLFGIILCLLSFSVSVSPYNLHYPLINLTNFSYLSSVDIRYPSAPLPNFCELNCKHCLYSLSSLFLVLYITTFLVFSLLVCLIDLEVPPL